MIVCRLLQPQRAFEAIDLGFVPPVSGCVSARQRFREHRESCRWLSYDPICLGKERQKIQPRYLYSSDMQGYQALAELLDPLLGLSLMRQRPAAQDRTQRHKER